MDGGGVKGGVENHSASAGSRGVGGDAGGQEFGIVTGTVGGFESARGILR
jgi:hypothetical protein